MIFQVGLVYLQLHWDKRWYYDLSDKYKRSVISWGAGSTRIMTEEKWSDVTVAVWLAGCEYFLQRLIILPHSQTEPQPGDQATSHWINIYQFLSRTEENYYSFGIQLDLNRTVQCSGAALLN